MDEDDFEGRFEASIILYEPDAEIVEDGEVEGTTKHTVRGKMMPGEQKSLFRTGEWISDANANYTRSSEMD